nr:ulp1 protease family, C-terminal catalytic domain-containing protein [Tanacetum cinerariifolium]
KDYPLSNAVMIMMLSAKLQVEEDSEMTRDLVMKIFIDGNKLKRRNLISFNDDGNKDNDRDNDANDDDGNRDDEDGNLDDDDGEVKMIFEAHSGKFSVYGIRLNLETLAPGLWIDVNVIDCGGAILNHEERFRDAELKSRHFFLTGCITKSIFNETLASYDDK